MSTLNTVPYGTNVSNFVSVKLLGKQNFLLWKAQMLCLLKSVNVSAILYDTFVAPRDFGAETVTQYDNLVRGWIFGSVSEVVLEEVYNLDSAKAVWEKLQSNYDPTMCLQDDTTLRESDVKTMEDEIDVVLADTTTINDDIGPIDIIVEGDRVPTEIETTNDDTQTTGNKIERKNKLKKLKSLIIKGNWSEIEPMLKNDKSLATEAISSDGSTILHVAVGLHHNYIVEKLIWHILSGEQIFIKRDSDGCTALHIAAIVGNKKAASCLVYTNHNLLRVKDDNDEEPLQKAYENMHLDTIAYLLKAIKANFKKSSSSIISSNKIDYINLIVNAVSAKQYGLASEFVEWHPAAVSENDEVLMALAKTFPSGLDDGEKLFYPSLKSTMELMHKTALLTIYLFSIPTIMIYKVSSEMASEIKKQKIVTTFLLRLFSGAIFLLFTVPYTLASAIAFICLLILILCFPFLLLYFILWKGAKILAFPPIKKIENKIMELRDAKKFLELVCDEIDKLNYTGTYHPCYTRPILEAACENAYDVVDEILSRSPEAIHSKDKSGKDIIQLAIMNRSEKIYNLIYDVDERKNLHKKYLDSSGNNILHLAGKLAPSSILNQRTGAALQLQRELQWREEVKKLVIPTYITQENIFKETPDMIFTREHKDLLKEGEQWMKTTAESCSITAALIITIVFAAAITVPGGSNQEKGTPLFKKEIAFIVFAVSDAISLFASSTTLLVFLSILTARFAEKDFLYSLPWRLFIGLFSLLLSTTAMMVAFSATLFLVFCDKKVWMLAPICGLAFIPIMVFVSLQFPLMVDLFSSTYLPIFGKESNVPLKNIIRKIYEYAVMVTGS